MKRLERERSSRGDEPTSAGYACSAGLAGRVGGGQLELLRELRDSTVSIRIQYSLDQHCYLHDT